MEKHIQYSTIMVMLLAGAVTFYALWFRHDLLVNPFNLQVPRYQNIVMGYTVYPVWFLSILYVNSKKLWMNICANIFLVIASLYYFEQSIIVIELVICLVVTYSISVSIVSHMEQKKHGGI